MNPMSHAKKKPPARKQSDQVNKKALIWIGAAFAAVVIVVGVLLALDI